MGSKEVFVTYSWNNDEHSDKVLAFTNFLRQNGFDAEMDKMLMQRESSINFKQMMHMAMTDYKKVIVVLSKGYKEKAESFKGGVGNEYTLILNDIDSNSRKYILVLFEKINDDIIPLFFKNREVIDLSSFPNCQKSEFEKLFRKLQDVDEYVFADVATEKPLLKPKVIPLLFKNSTNENLESIKFNHISGLADFSKSLLAPDVNVLKLLNLPLSKFQNASKYISDNTQDLENGVIEVYIQSNLHLFNIFETCVLKVYKNGKKQYFLYTTTKDTQKIIDVYETISLTLGIGIFDNRVNNSFRDISKIEDIANGFVLSKNNECNAMWHLNDVHTIWLNYHINPLQQFVLSIDEQKIIDIPNIRRNDSLLKYMRFDIAEVLQKAKELYRETEGGKVKYVDYWVSLPSPFLNVFTNLKIRIFGTNKFFDKNIQTHLFFYCKNNTFNASEIMSSVTQIADIYGADNSGNSKLKDYEIQNMKTYQSWFPGRWYSFNKDHRLLDRNSGEVSLYDVSIEYNDLTDEGLELSIIAFNNLVKYVDGEL